MKITSKARGSGLLGEGLHLVTIVGVAEVKSKTNTPQLEVTVSNPDGVRKLWFNLVGYKQNDQGDYLTSNGRVIKTEGLSGEKLLTALSKRVPDPDRTQTCQDMLGKFAYDALGEADVDIDTDDLVGQQIIIGVVGEGTAAKVPYTFNADKVETAEAVMSKALDRDVVFEFDED